MSIHETSHLPIESNDYLLKKRQARANNTYVMENLFTLDNQEPTKLNEYMKLRADIADLGMLPGLYPHTKDLIWESFDKIKSNTFHLHEQALPIALLKLKKAQERIEKEERAEKNPVFKGHYVDYSESGVSVILAKIERDRLIYQYPELLDCFISPETSDDVKQQVFLNSKRF
jgi:hypothetical protein